MMNKEEIDQKKCRKGKLRKHNIEYLFIVLFDFPLDLLFAVLFSILSSLSIKSEERKLLVFYRYIGSLFKALRCIMYEMYILWPEY